MVKDSSTPALELINIKKSFRSYWTFLPKKAVENVSLKVRHGEAFGFLGPNGAGKTTTIKCILGLLNITDGEILLNGKPLKGNDSRAEIGYLPEHPYFYDHLSVFETLDFFAALYGIPSKERAASISTAVDLCGLGQKLNDSVKSLSKGWQQRVGIAQAILNTPQLLILDEPFSGLDPRGRREVRELIMKLKANGTTILMSSHILSDVHDICDRISIMKDGVLESVFSLEEIPEIFGETIELELSNLDQKTEVLESIRKLADDELDRITHQIKKHIFVFKDYQKAHQALADCMNAGAKVERFEKKSKSLEQIFVALTEGVTELESVAVGDISVPMMEETAQ
jgi:ABC-2 type transport system ATP-binding protein